MSSTTTQSAFSSPDLSAATHLLSLREAMTPVPLREREVSKKSREDLAEKGQAMPDKQSGGRYPIENAEDVENAVNDWGRSGSSPDVKAHIISAAKKVGATAALPEDWEGSTKKKLKEAAGRLGKTLAGVRLREAAFPIMSEYDIASAARIAGELWADSQMSGSVEDEAAATTLAKTLKGVRERHTEEIELGGCCACGPSCCC